MQMLTKTNLKRDLHPAVIGQDWELLAPLQAEAGVEHYDLTKTRAALLQAETVIRAQEDRIRALEAVAMTDDTTGLFNRRGFMAAFDRELALARRDTGCCGIVVLIDLDDIKAISEKCGYQASDAYLCSIATVLKESVRHADSVARIASGQFALLLTHMDADTGAKRLARLEQAFAKRALILHERISVQANFGFAAYSGTDEANSVMAQAETMLADHAAKNKKAIPADV